MIVTISGSVTRLIQTRVEGFSKIRMTGSDVEVIGDFGSLKESEDIVVLGRKEKHKTYGLQVKIVKWWRKAACPISDLAAVSETFTYLTETLALTPKISEKIFLAYLTDARKIIEENPYRIATDGLVPRASVKLIDEKIAPKLGIDPLDTRRLKAAILEALSMTRRMGGLPTFTDDSGVEIGAPGGGHTYIEMPHLVCHIAEEMSLERKTVKNAILELAREPRNDIDTRPLLKVDLNSNNEPRFVYFYALHRAESGLAHHVRRLLDAPADTMPEMDVVLPTNITLTDEQISAVKMALTSKISIITGGPGVGKTTIIKAITDTLRKAGYRDGEDFHLCAFTGVAARRMQDATECQSSTIHRLLKVNPATTRFQHDKDNPLATRFVICDEASMIHLGLLSSLFDAIPPYAKVLLVGDVDQLPPIEAGSPFKDLISWDKIPTTRLTKIHRQELANSLIIQGSRKILDKQFPVFSKDLKEGDLFAYSYTDDEKALKTALDLLCNEIPKNFNIGVDKIQIIAPIKRKFSASPKPDALPRMLSTDFLNEAIQEKLTGKPKKNCLFNEGDRVIHIKNNYSLNVMNGEIGYVEEVNLKSGEFCYKVRYGQGGTVIDYSPDDAKELNLAYALTIHKMQGLEAPAVILLAYKWGDFFTKNMLYTAITRGKRVVAVLSPKGGASFKHILSTNEKNRNSRLIWRMENESIESDSLGQMYLNEISGDDDL